MPLFVRTGDLPVNAWWKNVEHLAVGEFLSLLIIPRWIYWIIQLESSFVPWHSGPPAIISKTAKTRSVSEYLLVPVVITPIQGGPVRHWHFLHYIARQTTKRAYAQPSALARCQRAGLMTIETQCKIVENWCFMPARGVMYIFWKSVLRLHIRLGSWAK